MLVGARVRLCRNCPRPQHESPTRLLDPEVPFAQQDVILLLDGNRSGYRNADDRCGCVGRVAYGYLVRDALANAITVSYTAQPLTLVRTCSNKVKVNFNISITGVSRSLYTNVGSMNGAA